MGKVSEITVTKGKTVKVAEREEWVKLEFSIKIVDVDEQEVEAAKTYGLGLLDGWLSSSLPSPTPANSQAAVPAKQLRPEIFPEDLRKLLAFEEKEGFLIIKPRQFLGSENFARIAEIVRARSGEYVSSGKGSHFKVPLK